MLAAVHAKLYKNIARATWYKLQNMSRIQSGSERDSDFVVVLVCKNFRIPRENATC